MKTTTHTTLPPSFFLGIDVGKKDLFCHIIGSDQSHSERFDNTLTGIRLLLKWITKTCIPTHLVACLEQTGHYGDSIAEALYKLKLAAVYLVYPQRIKAFGMQKLRRNKSDTADAKLIARFLKSEHFEMRPWQPRSHVQQQITALSRYVDSLTQNTARLKTMLEGQTERIAITSIKRRIKLQEKEILTLNRKIKELIKSDPGLQAKSVLLKSIPGLGDTATHIVIAELPDLDHFDDARQLAAWAGLTPRHFVSGTSGKTRTPITKIGSCRLRRGLFMPAMTARIYNPLLREFAERLLKNGKKRKEVIIAIMRKLLHQIYGILKSGQPYNPEKRGYAGT